MLFERLINLKIFLAKPSQNGFRQEIDISNLRVSFSVFKTESFSTNQANIRIYNLSRDNRNALSNFGDEVRLFAGYRDNGGTQLLFRGNVTQLSHTFPQPEIISVLNCGDGDKVINDIIVSVSFAPGIAARTVIQSIADQMGLDQIVYFAPTDELIYVNGFSGSDLAKDVLTNACNKLNLIWTVQNNNLIIMKQNVGNPKPPSEINVNTGMIGVPERYTDKRQYLYRPLPPNADSKPGWKVRTLLRPDIIPGDRVRIRSELVDLNGLFYVISIRHEGDNFGSQFESLLEVVEV